MTFEELGLGPEVLKAIADCGYTQPTPIQEKAIPIVLMGRDIIGLAQTGTGKTASFTVPMIEILSNGRARARMPRSLILSPTRELAAQIAENFDLYGKYHPLSKALLVGGESMGDQQKILERGVDVLIATPGRLLDLFDRGNILLSDIKILVIDEADRMLDMGFIPDIEKIVSKIPPIRQTLLFSATMPPEIKKLADKFMSNPKTVTIEAPAAKPIEEFLVWVQDKQKRQALRQIIQQEELKNAFVFCNRKREVGELAKWLKDKGFNAAPMHGDLVQTVRTQTLKDFKEDKIKLLVCSDVAARGLDVDAVSHVFNYDVPFSAEDYIHRIGRTGRAGMKGRAWTIAAEDDVKFVKAIEKLIKRDIPVQKLEAFDKPDLAEAEDGKRPSPRGRREREPRRARSETPRSAEAAPVRQQEPSSRPPRREQTPTPARATNAERPRRETADEGPDKFGDDNMPAFLRR
jgi:superfamily II DNA/RNA helicase